MNMRKMGGLAIILDRERKKGKRIALQLPKHYGIITIMIARLA